MKTMKESGHQAVQVIRAAVTMIAQEDWTDTIQEHKVQEVCIFFLLASFLSFFLSPLLM